MDKKTTHLSDAVIMDVLLAGFIGVVAFVFEIIALIKGDTLSAIGNASIISIVWLAVTVAGFKPNDVSVDQEKEK